MPVRAFIETLRLSQVLDLEQLEEVTRALAHCHDNVQALANELVHRNWLTPFQMEQLLQARGHELVLGQYLLLEKLGEGGMGHVFKARHRLMERVVALKVIRQELTANPTAVSRFHREIRAAAKLFHPHIALAYDAARVDDLHFFVMEYVEGTDLGRLVLQRGALPLGQACSYIRQAALGLQHAHEQGLVHRDVKPSNLLLSTRASTVKLVDLGLARLHEVNTAPLGPLTSEGLLMGTPDFIAPEQAEDSHTVDIRGDIYSLGCTLYFLLTGQVPFPGGSWLNKIRRHQEEQPAPLESVRTDLPHEILTATRRAMAKSPNDRFQTPMELVQVLEPFCRGLRPAPMLPTLHDPAELMPSTMSETDFSRGPQPLSPHPPVGQPELPRWIVNHLGMVLVLVPAGSFLMGSPPDEAEREEDEGPLHLVTISRPFYLGIYPVRQREYAALMGRNPSVFDPANGGSPDHPVENVSWAEAVEFCHRLSELPAEQRAERVYRLPSEAEWEYACRAGTLTPFSVGASLSSDQANFDGRNPYGGAEVGPYVRRTTRVGSYQDNPWGLYDMHGNVWEWCSDWYDKDYYAASPAIDPVGPARGQFRVVRGGSWHFYGEECRSAYRGRGSADFRLSIGFRVVQVPNAAGTVTRSL